MLTSFDFDDFDPATVYTTPGSARTRDITAESVMESVRKLGEFHKFHKTDIGVLICLPLACEAIRKQMPASSPLALGDRLFGIPIFVAHSAEEALKLYADKLAEGLAPIIVAAPGDPLVYPLPPIMKPPEKPSDFFEF